jgi:hypothetical protein
LKSSPNRANARRSTGPRTPAGKAAVARNAINHGIYAQSPVVDGFETAADWTAYRAAMLANLAPEGMLEETLAERIILTAWRLRRTARYETEQLRLTQEVAHEQVNKSLAFDLGRSSPKEVDLAGELLDEREKRQRRFNHLTAFAESGDEVPVSLETLLDLLALAHLHLDQGHGFKDHWQRLTKTQPWTAGAVRDLIGKLAAPRNETFETCFAAMQKAVAEEWETSMLLAGRVERELDHYRRRHLLADEVTLGKVMRYEAHLARLFHRDLHEFERLQARRLGQSVATPMVMDIDVTTDASKTSETAG